MKCVILQPSYIPWRGYFHQIHLADHFVFYDDVQYDHRGWRNRNRIKTATGPIWLTVPVFAKGHQIEGVPICEVAIDWSQPWARKHLESLRRAYARAPFFDRYRPLLEEIYGRRHERLADFTIESTVRLARELGLRDTRFSRSSRMGLEGSRTERLIHILEHLGADHYITGPSARSYLDEDRMTRAGIRVEFMTYDYPEYEQVHPPYDPRVSVLDLLFMKGPDSMRWIETGGNT